jgi:hypothetical protein
MAQFVRHDIPRKSCSFALKKISRSAMSNGAGNYELYLAVGGGADDEEVDEYRRALQWELNELEGVARVDQISAA